jgi:hypothetical protein
MIAVGGRERKRAVGSFRGLRGGSWNNNENNLRSSNRNNNNPDNENNNIGFRVASPRETRRRVPGQNSVSERARGTVPFSGTTRTVPRDRRSNRTPDGRRIGGRPWRVASNP